MRSVNQLLTDRFRCPNVSVEFAWPGVDTAPAGFFRFGDDVVCYASSSVVPAARTVTEPLHNALGDVHIESSRCVMPFDPTEVVDNLRCERYVRNAGSTNTSHHFHSLIRRAYYGVRPLLPLAVRKHFQRLFLARRMDTPFPNWPVDRTVDRFHERLLALTMKAQGIASIPFIWFWPEGHMGAFIMTHDVEMPPGVRFCKALMDIDDGYGIQSSFQFVPEERYSTPKSLLNEMRRRGFEINVHDLNHDGRLYWNRKEFLRRAAKINQYAQQFQTNGFRSGVLYRNLEWYDAFDFSFDMSVPNVGHLDPQAGGCCTLMPYFIGKILELPVTATQDYPLFHVLGEYSIELWIHQINLILDGHGLISFITHPDYLVENRARMTYRTLLAHISRLRSEVGLWTALPGQVNDWWRTRSQMQLVQQNGKWRVEGPDNERARVAYAHLDGEGVRYTIETGADEQSGSPGQFLRSSHSYNG